MLNQESIRKYRSSIEDAGLREAPRFHVVLGSGFGAALEHIEPTSTPWKLSGELSFTDVPGLPGSTVQDHAGRFRFYKHEASGQGVTFQLGRLHGYEGHSARLVVQPVMLGRLAGTQCFLLTNAAGGIDPNHRTGDAMLIRDHVNMTGQNPLVGPNPVGPHGKELGPRFPDLSCAYEPDWREALKTALQKNNVRTHEGVYMGLLGPSFETPSEVKLFGQWGIHAVGMSTVWEAIALKHSGARIGGLSLISNAACGLGDGEPLEHEKIVEACRTSAGQIVRSILDWLDGEIRK